MQVSQRSASPRRTGLAITGSILVFALLILQLGKITITPATNYQGFAKSESLQSVVIPAPRGEILDGNGNPLALSAPRESLVVDPLQVTNPLKEAGLLSPIVGMAVAQIRALFLLPGQFAYVDRLMSNAVSQQIRTLISQGDLPGLSLITEMARVYPDGALAEPVIGRTGQFGSGLSGIEYQYNSLLMGKDGSQVQSVSNAGVPIPNGVVSYRPAIPGPNVKLTLDESIQFIAERALAADVESTRALGGSLVVMNVKTGDILAMVNISAPALPTPKGAAIPQVSSMPQGAVAVDSGRSLPTEAWANYAVGSVYEPGSVAKIATFTAALEKGIITPKTQLEVPDHITIDGHVFHDAEKHPTTRMTVGQILGQSSNVGTILIAQKLGKYALTKSFVRYGWGLPTGLNFPGESQGYLDSPAKWSGTAIGSVPIGQDEAVTPLQVLDSYNAIANGGVMVAPKLVLSITPSSGKAIVPFSPKPHRIVSRKISAEMTTLLENAISANGTAPAAAIPGYKVAGKTGTSQKPWPNQPGYQPGAFWATFVGFAPASHPVLSAIVELDQPTPIYGGEVAAPVFAQVMTYALQHLKVSPQGQVAGTSPTRTLPRGSLAVIPRAKGRVVTGGRAIWLQ